MAIAKVWINEGCTLCANCENICPEIFEVHSTTAIVRGAHDFNRYEEEIIQAAEECPVNIIHYR